MAGIPALHHLRRAYAATPQAAMAVVATGHDASLIHFIKHAADA